MKCEAEKFDYNKMPQCSVFKPSSARYIDGSRVTEEDGEDVFMTIY